MASNESRRARLRLRFGITPEQYDALFEAQDGRCAICRAEPGGRWKRLEVDHDHVTGAIRGLLCVRCNIAVGLVGDDPGVAHSIAVYLDQEPQILAMPIRFQRGMRYPVPCSDCRSPRTHVIRTRRFTNNQQRRYRLCDECGHRFDQIEPRAKAS